jgi:insertion element IS1 protein InsB
VNQAVLRHLHAAHVEVEIWRADELAQRRGVASELDEMWAYVAKKTNSRWLWHAIDHHSGKVLAYVFGGKYPEMRAAFALNLEHLPSILSTRTNLPGQPAPVWSKN